MRSGWVAGKSNKLMSACGGKSAHQTKALECLLLTQSGHRQSRDRRPRTWLLVVDHVQPRACFLPECDESLCARHEEQDAEIQPRWLTYYLSLPRVAGHR